MGTTSEKLTYLNTTKGKIKDSINLTGANITTEPFRQYSTKLQDAYVDIINNGTSTLYSNFPKVNSEGTSLTLNNTYQAPMVNVIKGNTIQDGTPTPSSPIPVNVVSGDNEIVVCGKNLFDVTSFENQLVSGKILNDSGNEISDASSTYSKYKVFLKANTEYRLDGWWQRIYYYDTNGIFKSRSASISGGVNRSYTPTVDEYIGFQIYNSQWSEYKGQEQIEIGSSASTYEAYNGNTYNIDLPSGIELCKIGTYQDYIYKDSDKWYLHKEIGKVVLNGSETDWATRGGGTTYAYSCPNIFDGNKTLGICSHWQFIQGGASDSQSYECIASANTNTSLAIFTNNSSLDTLANLKTWLGTNQPIVYYALATPTNTEITDTTLINQLEELYIAKSKEDQTNISQINNDLGFIISASALKKG